VFHENPVMAWVYRGIGALFNGVPSDY
jgi:hypothetical protein